jgi:hypothetical protein
MITQNENRHKILISAAFELNLFSKILKLK